MGRLNIKNNYNHTVFACYFGYIIQAIVNNFVPLLFLTFQNIYNIPLDKITLINQEILVDESDEKLADHWQHAKPGYKCFFKKINGVVRNTCPAGYERDGDNCTLTETIDCTEN